MFYVLINVLFLRMWPKKFHKNVCSRKKAIRMCDSSSDCEIERCESEKEHLFDIVPGDKLFTIKLKRSGGKTYRIIEYELKGGKLLPYIVKNRIYINLTFVLSYRNSVWQRSKACDYQQSPY